MYPEHYSGPPDFVSPQACHHSYVTQACQSQFLETDHQTRNTGGASSSRVRAVCSKCRYHAQVILNYTAGRQTLPGHIHHFVCSSGSAKTTTSTSSKGQQVETYDYECSFLTCSAHAVVCVASPILDSDAVRLLTSSGQLRKRADEALAAFPDRLSDVPRPHPIDVLNNLRAYISDALYDTSKGKSISAINKRFMICFGIRGLPCKDLLEFLEFKPKVCRIPSLQQKKKKKKKKSAV